MQQVLREVLWSLSSTLISHQRSHGDLQPGESLTDGIAAGHAPSLPGLCSPQHPASSAPALPAGKPLNSQSSEEQMPWQSWFSRAISLSLPHSSSFPIPPSPCCSPSPCPSLISTSPMRSCPLWAHRYMCWQQIPENPCCRPRDVPFLPPIPSRGRGNIPAPGWPSARPCHLPVPSRPAGRGDHCTVERHVSIDLQSNLIGLWRPLDWFHLEQGLQKYMNK